MKLADEMMLNFSNRIKEIHLSGHDTFHDPLYRSHHPEIIQRCINIEAPIIIESTFTNEDGVDGAAKEYAYVAQQLGYLSK